VAAGHTIHPGRMPDYDELGFPRAHMLRRAIDSVGERRSLPRYRSGCCTRDEIGLFDGEPGLSSLRWLFRTRSIAFARRW